ncbi:(d)CMP kinase [Heliophilum fasciatum]|uniref:Cytidylate kinase n=1 Tax=Heliophilum fasciatum TaxID=35700 RepID=A0A4R2RL26_9FIRM|nr:(d)CMP kinase [Heliophilum fasciatum]MCW2278303.1 cytidylate kinase [Heliophilum fasciatum]TCP63823.1 cytidylate kinase [Heliophilum fasciatum]
MTEALKAVAIDGPAGAGKSTVAREVARRLNYLYIDTGAMYRALAWWALRQDVGCEPVALTALAEAAEIRLVATDEGTRVWIHGHDVTEAIRSPEVSQHVSQVAAVAGVRAPMVRLQQQMAAQGCVVMDGRDIGTRVLPMAQVKIFLTASIEERALRRYRELCARGVPVELAALQQEIEARDQADSSRATDPLRQADDAVVIDTTGMGLEQVIEAVLATVRRKVGDHGA